MTAGFWSRVASPCREALGARGRADVLMQAADIFAQLDSPATGRPGMTRA